MKSNPIFEANDTVVSRGNPFWMTVKEVNPSTGRCRCYFGTSGDYAGSFTEDELEFYGGAELLGQRAPRVLAGPHA